MSDARAPTANSSFYLQASPASPQAASLSISGNATIQGNVNVGGKLSGDGTGLTGVALLSSANASFQGQLSAGSISTSGALSAGSISTSGALSAGATSVSSLSASGNVSAATFSGNGAGLTGVVVGTSQVTGLASYVTGLAQQADEQLTTLSSTAAAVTLGANDAEIVLIDSSSHAVTVNLPAGPAAGRVFTIKDAAGSAGVNAITLNAGASNIDGSATQTISTANGFKTLVYSSSRWAITAESNAPPPTHLGPILSAYAGSSATSGQAAVNKIAYDTVEVDTDASFDAVNHRFKPAKAGYYLIALQLNMTESGTGGFTLYLSMEKNASIIKQSVQLINYPGAFNQSMNIASIVYMNGSSDYIEGFFETNSGTATIIGGSSQTYMTASYVHE